MPLLILRLSGFAFDHFSGSLSKVYGRLLLHANENEVSLWARHFRAK